MTMTAPDSETANLPLSSSHSPSRFGKKRLLILVTILLSVSIAFVILETSLTTSLPTSLSEKKDFFLRREEQEVQVIQNQENNLQHVSGDEHGDGVASIFGESSNAAEKLECPVGVISFVVNATDVKDECEGLRKAFDQTCNSHHEKANGERRMKHRRRLSLVETVTSASADVLGKGLTWHPIREHLGRRLTSLKNRGVQEADRQDHKGEHEKEGGEEPSEDEKQRLSPALPTGKVTVGDNMVNDALILNADLDEIAKAIEGIHNYTKDNEESFADHVEQASKEEADELKSAAVAVSAAMNSPELIETQVCCRSILKVFHEECDSPEEEEFNDKRLFVIVCVIALCGIVKSLIRHFKIRWLPEAGGCIIVGVVGGMCLTFLPNMDFGFQHDMFLRLMVPPIVFEAALNINKNSFAQMAIPIVIFAIWGTFMSTLLSAAIVYYGTAYFNFCANIPFVESLAFGALISSIDPIAVLSVLNNMGMSDKDPIYVLIFGESLLNDGVAIVLFQTLVHFMDEKIVIDSEACWLATLHFLVIAFGSVFVGLTCGIGATIYFWLMKGIQTPLVEVLMFICWAFIPYYICDGVDWSGIVAIVAAGFFMDIYVIGSRTEQQPTDANGEVITPENGHANMVPSRQRSSGVFSQEGFLSAKAKNHIGFVTEINATLMETAIFAYLGIFLFNRRYHWSIYIPLLAIVSCTMSRSIMVVFSSALSNTISKLSSIGKKKMQTACAGKRLENDKLDTVQLDGRMQIVLIFAGLRGAMSFALVETVPMYDQSTGEGSRYKPELKAMTSACIVFTVFILGGYTYYLLEKLGMGPVGKEEDVVEMVSLINTESTESTEDSPWGGKDHSGLLQRRRRILCPDPNTNLTSNFN